MIEQAPAAASEANPAPGAQYGSARRLGLFASAAGVFMLCAWQWTTLQSLKDTYSTSLSQLTSMRTDATAILALRQTPQLAASRTRPHEALLAQVEQALSAAGIDKGHWQDSVPQPSVRIPKSDYRCHSTRLYFEGVSLRQLAAMAWCLSQEDPTLEVAGLEMRSEPFVSDLLQVNITVSYLVYSPGASVSPSLTPVGRR